jgi:hypothetical protein
MSVHSILNDSYPVDHIHVHPVEHPIEVWSRVHHWLDRAFDQSHSLVTAADMFHDIVRRNSTLWVVEKRKRLLGTFITRIERGSRGKALNLVAIGGDGMKDWIESFDAAFTQYAHAQGCKFTCVVGRKGWVRVLGRLGWVPGAHTMMKVL